MNKKVVIIGAGGHAKVIAEIIKQSKDQLIGFLDDNKDIQFKKIFDGKMVIGTTNDIARYNEHYFIIGIGNNEIRKKISNCNLKWYTAIHPKAIIASDVKIGEGTVVMPGAVINPGTTIGKHCIINTSASVDHDNIIDDYVHISPGSHLAGTVHIKEGSWICAGAIIINNITIEKNCIIGAGAVVLKNINESNNTYVGVPAKKIKKNDSLNFYACSDEEHHYKKTFDEGALRIK